MADNPKGQSLGRATASIFLAAEKFADGLRVVQRVSLDAGKAVDSMGGAFDRAKKYAVAFDNTSLGKLQGQIKAVRDQIVGVSIAAAGLTIFGVKSAQDINRTRTSIELLTGSVQKADKVFADIRKLTDRFNVPFDDAIKGAQAFLPIAKTTGVAVDELVKSAIRFQAYNPAKSFDEIKFSINEALSGDFVSIKDTLDLSRKQRDELKRLLEEQGPQALLGGLNDILVERGFDDETLEKFGESGANAFAQIKSEIKETMAVAFTPLLKDVVLPLVKGFGEFVRSLREVNPDLLKFGAGVTAIVAAGAPLLTFLTSAIGLYKAYQAAQAAAGVGSAAAVAAAAAGGRQRDAAGRFISGAGQTATDTGTTPARGSSLLKTGLAVGGGVVLGLGAATFAARNLGVETGDLGRIKNGESAGAVLVERLKQIVVIVVDQLLNFAGTLGKVALFVKNAIEQFVNVFKLGGTIIGEVFANLRMVFGRFIEAIGGVVASLPGQKNNGLLIQQAGLTEQFNANSQIIDAQKERDRLVSELARGFMPKQEDLDAVDEGIQGLKDTVLGGLIDILGLGEQVVESNKPKFDNASKVGGSGSGGPVGDSEEYLKQQAEEIAAATQQYNDDLVKLETQKQQDIIALNERFAQEQVQIAQDRVKAERQALADLQEDLAKLNTDLARDTEKEGRERQRKILEMEIEFQRTEVADAEAHRDKLLKIEDDYRKKQEQAIENFDFAALFDLSEQVKEQTDSANQEYDKQRQERLQALQYEREDQVREFGAQREERLIEYEQNRADRQAEYEKERNQIAVESVERALLAQQAHANDMAQLSNKFAAEQSLRQQAYANELTLLMQTEAQRAAIIAQTQQALLQQAYDMARQFGLSSGSGIGSGRRTESQTNTAAEAQQQAARDRAVRNDELARQGRKVSGYAFGGTALKNHTSVVSELSPERFKRGAQIYNLPGNAGLFTPLDDGTVIPGGGRGAPSVTVQVALNAPVDHGLLTIEEAVALIERGAREGAETVLSEFMSQYER